MDTAIDFIPINMQRRYVFTLNKFEQCFTNTYPYLFYGVFFHVNRLMYSVLLCNSVLREQTEKQTLFYLKWKPFQKMNQIKINCDSVTLCEICNGGFLWIQIPNTNHQNCIRANKHEEGGGVLRTKPRFFKDSFFTEKEPFKSQKNFHQKNIGNLACEVFFIKLTLRIKSGVDDKRITYFFIYIDLSGTDFEFFLIFWTYFFL